MNIYLIALLGWLALIEVQMYSQNEYKAVLDHIVSTGYNKKLIDYMYAKNIKLNRTYKAINIGFRTKLDLFGNKFKARLQALQFFHNEYRRTPILFDVKICDVFEMNTFGMGKLATENGNLTKCPLRKGTYVIHDFNFDSTKFPPNIPRGRWLLQVRIIMGDNELGGIDFYGSIEDILKY